MNMANKNLPKTQNIFKGSVIIGRDQINGDQINYNFSPPASREEFIVRLQQLQAQIIEIKKEPMTSTQTKILELAEGKVNEAVSETEQPKPLGDRIKNTLTEAKETMDMLSTSLTSAVTLGTTIGGLILLVSKFFGG
jgi:hypothetical protein